MATEIKTALLDPDIMFGQDVIAHPEIAPQLQDRERTPFIKAYRKGTFPHRKPDISTSRTDAYITGWEEKSSKDRP